MNKQLQKVISGLECCMSGQPEGLGCDRVPCPYNDIEDCEGALHYDALTLLKSQEPRVMTLEEYKTEAEKPKHERDPVWEEWIFEGWELKSGWCMPNPAYGGYGRSWRCWTSRPTDEQREAIPWEEVEM